MSQQLALIELIVDSIKGSPRSWSEVDLIVRRQIEDLKSVLAAPPAWGKQADNKQYGDEIGKLVRTILKKLDGMPEGSLRALSAFSAYARETMPRAENLDLDRIELYERVLRSALEDLALGANAVKQYKIGDYHTLDRTKHFCAATAYEILIGLEAEEPTSGDPFRFIANSLFQIVAPDEVRAWRRAHKEDPDLRSQCEKVLSNWRSQPDLDRQHRAFLSNAFAGMIAQKTASSM